MPEQLYVGIDIGASKFSTAVAVSDPSGGARYLGHGRTPAAGLRAGEVKDQLEFNKAIKAAIDEARTLSGYDIADIVVSVSGTHLVATTNQGQVSLDAGYPIYQPDIDRVLSEAQPTAQPGYQTIHRVVQGFAVNGDPIRNPVGRTGQTLQVWVRDFSLPMPLVEAIQRAASEQKARVHAIIPSAVASGEAVLRQDERERGVILMDIGAMTTEIALYADGSLFDIGGFELGSHHITRDLATLLDMPLPDAEQIKCRHGVSSVLSAEALGVDWSPRGIASIQNQARNGTLRRDVPRAIAGARIEQIVGELRQMLQRAAGDLQFRAGVVITGGAASAPGIDAVVRELMHLEVRCGDVLPCEGFPPIADPTSSGSIGLVRYCAGRAHVQQSPRRPRGRSREREQPANVGAGPFRMAVSGGAPEIDVTQAPRTERAWGQAMREWARGFIPARGDV